MSDSAVAIEVHELVREFRKGPRAVDGIDLAVQTGEIYGFLGPNGAGKSTTVHVLTTLLPPTSGRATVGGFDIVREGGRVRAAIGAALQEAALDAILTGREHLMLQATLQGIPATERKQRAQALLDRVGLGEAADRRVGGYSGGMKRRLDLAMALDNVRSNKFRSFLTVLGIVIGVMAAIVVASILTGMRQNIVAIIEEYGTNNIYAFHLTTGPRTSTDRAERLRKALSAEIGSRFLLPSLRGWA